MLPIFAVLLVAAHSALAAPSIAVSAYPVNQYPVAPDTGRLVSSFLIDGSAAYLDTADVPMYANMMLASLDDMANSADTCTQAAAIVNAIATIGELVSGIPGDACDNAAVINAYVNSVNTGNKAGLRQAVISTFIGRFFTYIDLITQLLVNPRSVKFTTGPRGNCLGGGRTYQFEEAWDGILNNASPFQISLLNEVYCAARRMYYAYSVTSNNLGAASTAANIPVINQIAQKCLSTMAPFMRAVANGSDPSQAAAAVKSALAEAAANVSY